MKWGCSEEIGQPKDGSPPLLLSDSFPDEDSWATNSCIFQGQALLLWSLFWLFQLQKSFGGVFAYLTKQWETPTLNP